MDGWDGACRVCVCVRVRGGCVDASFIDAMSDEKARAWFGSVHEIAESRA